MTSYQGQAASGSSRQHNGNIYGNVINFSPPPRSPSAVRRDDEALLKAASQGNTEQAATLIANGASPHHTDRLGFTALHHACLCGHEETARALIDAHGSDINAVSAKYGRPICLAAVNGHRRVVAMLIQRGASVKGSGGHIGSALHAACYAGDTDIIEMLLEAGAPVDLVSTIQYATGSELQVVNPHELLPPDKGPATAFKLDQCRPLHVAAMNENSDVLRLLLYKGAEVDATGHGSITGRMPQITDTFKCSALLVSSTVSCLSALLDAGADIEQTDKYSATKMMNAASNGNLPCLKLFLERGAYLGARSEQSETALHTAGQGGKLPCVRYLLAQGADVTARNDCGFVPVMSAILGGRRQCVAIFTEFWKSQLDPTSYQSRENQLRERHVPFNASDTMTMLQHLRVDLNAPFTLAGNRQCPLWFAIEHQMDQSVELLLDLGASMKNEMGQGARDFALHCNKVTRTQGWHAIINILDRYASSATAATVARGVVPRQTSAEEVLMTMLAKGLKRVFR